MKSINGEIGGLNAHRNLIPPYMSENLGFSEGSHDGNAIFV